MFKAIIAASRLKTLPAAFVPVGLSIVLVRFEGLAIDWGLAVFTTLATLFIQLATNYFNDVIDAAKGADNERRLGPVRATSKGMLSPKFVTVMALVSILIASLLGLPLLEARGWPLLLIGVPAIYLTYGYTGGPFPLAYRGMGELFVLLWFGLIAVGGSYFVQTGGVSLNAIILGLQAGFYSVVMIAINNLRDLETDKAVGKNTIMVLWGRGFGQVLVIFVCLMPDLVGLYWLGVGRGDLWLFPLIATLPTKAVLVAGVLRSAASAEDNKLLATGALQLILFGVTWALVS